MHLTSFQTLWVMWVRCRESRQYPVANISTSNQTQGPMLECDLKPLIQGLLNICGPEVVFHPEKPEEVIEAKVTGIVKW